MPLAPSRWGSRASEAAADTPRGSGLRSAVGADQRRWPAVGRHGCGVTREVRLPADTEARLAGFTELVATALANAEARLR